MSSPFEESDLWLFLEEPITLLSHNFRLFIFCNLMGLRLLQEIDIYHPRMRVGNVFGHVCVSVCLGFCLFRL